MLNMSYGIDMRCRENILVGWKHMVEVEGRMFKCVQVIRQIFWNTNVPKTVFCEFLPKFQYGRLFFDVVRIGQMHIALVHTVRVFIQYNTLL